MLLVFEPLGFIVDLNNTLFGGQVMIWVHTVSFSVFHFAIFMAGISTLRSHARPAISAKQGRWGLHNPAFDLHLQLWIRCLTQPYPKWRSCQVNTAARYFMRCEYLYLPHFHSVIGSSLTGEIEQVHRLKPGKRNCWTACKLSASTI
jgi:hypothetical protein